MGADLNRAAPALQASPIAFSHFLAAQAVLPRLPGRLSDRPRRPRAGPRRERRRPAVRWPAAAPRFRRPTRATSSVPAACDDVMRAALPAARLPGRLPLRGPSGGEGDRRPPARGRELAWSPTARRRRTAAASRPSSRSATPRRRCWCWSARSGWAWPRPTPSPAPVARLVQAAGRVAGGDLSARVDADNDPDEIAVLSRAFNRMTNDLQAQQEALRRASEDAEARRQFIETVLAEVSAGVIGLDAEGRISAANRQAAAAAGPARRRRRAAASWPRWRPEFAAVAAGAQRRRGRGRGRRGPRPRDPAPAGARQPAAKAAWC